MATKLKNRVSGTAEYAPDQYNKAVSKPDNSTTGAGYKPSASVNAAQQAVTVHNSEKPSAFTSKYDGLINDNLNKILNREQFTYDPTKDSLYNQYKDMYTRNGQTAMKDTMGNAALLTGGYGNSYATTAGQQAYNSYMQQLNDKIPELEERAYNRYRDETSNLYNQSNLLTNLDNTDYGRYRDKMSDYLNDRDYYYNAYNNERNFDYGKYRDAVSDAKDDRNFNYQKERDAVSDAKDGRNFNYQKERDAVGDAQWEKQFEYQRGRDAISDAQWEKTYNYNVAKGIASAQKDSEDDTYFDPDKAYKFLTDYSDYFDVKDNPSEVAEALFQSYGDKDGFWEWADTASIGDGSLTDLIFSMHPELIDDTTLSGTNSWGDIGMTGIVSNAESQAKDDALYADYRQLKNDSDSWSTSRQKWLDDNKKAHSKK